jgi:type II secretory pathway component PulM
MSLRHSSERIHRFQRHAAIGLMVVLALTWAVLVRPVTSRLAQARGELESERLALAESTQQTDRLPLLEAEVARLTTQVGRFKSASPLSQLDATFKEISALAEGSPVRGYQFAPREERRHNFGPEQVVEMKFESGFYDAWQFINSVESMDRLLRVREMSIRTSRDPERVEVKVLLSLFFTS